MKPIWTYLKSPDGQSTAILFGAFGVLMVFARLGWV